MLICSIHGTHPWSFPSLITDNYDARVLGEVHHDIFHMISLATYRDDNRVEDNRLYICTLLSGKEENPAHHNLFAILGVTLNQHGLH